MTSSPPASGAQTGPRTCAKCDAPFIPAFLRSSICPPCQEAANKEHQRRSEAEQAGAVAEARQEAWERFSPKLYRASDRALLPLAAIAATDAYIFGPKGLALVGESGRGKTRSMMLLGKRLILEEGRRGEYVTGTMFSRLIASMGCEVGDFIRKLHRCEFLLIDDLSKAKMTESVQAHLHDVLEERTANLRPTFWTSNVRGNELAHMFDPDRAEPIMRRLASPEFSIIVRV